MFIRNLFTKHQLAVKDQQMAAKDAQILKLMDAQERSDILLKGLQDRVRQLEAPGSRTEYDRRGNRDQAPEPRDEKLDRGLDTQEEAPATDVQPNVQVEKQDVQPKEQGIHEEPDAVDGDFEETDQAGPEDVPPPKPDDVQSDVPVSASTSQPANEKQGTGEPKTEEHEDEQGSGMPKEPKQEKQAPRRRWWRW